MPDCGPKNRPEPPEPDLSPDVVGEKAPLQPEPELDDLVRGFSTSLDALKGLIRELAGQKEQEAAAARQHQAWGAHYRNLFDCAPGAYLVTDNEAIIQEANPAAAGLLRLDRDFLAGQRLTSFIVPDDQETISSLLEELRQGSGTGGSLVHWQPTGGTPVFLAIAGRRDPGGELIGFNWLIQDLTAGRQAPPGADRIGRLESCLAGLVGAISTAAELQDPYAAGHQRRVAQLAGGIAQQLGFSPERVEGLKIMGYLHDIGKVALPAGILSKLGLLTIAEENVLRTHPLWGYDLLKNVDFPWPVARAVLQQHERWDGSGYPGGLAGENILLEARILAVADVVVAGVAPQPFGVTAALEEALEEVYKQSGVLYDPRVVEALLKLFVENGFKFD